MKFKCVLLLVFNDLDFTIQNQRLIQSNAIRFQDLIDNFLKLSLEAKQYLGLKKIKLCFLRVTINSLTYSQFVLA